MGENIFRRGWEFATSPTGQGILKCSLAYLLACMATFVAPIAAILGRQDGKHMVATITVYFHSARSQGSMIEATIYATFAFLYFSFVSFASMAVSVAFAALDMQALGHAVVLLVFCGGGLGFVGWVKQRRGDPLVNVACSLTCLATITILTKEGSIQESKFSADKIAQVMTMVVMGICLTACVCLLLRPVSARREVRQTMIKATDSLGEMLDVITRSFLSGAEEELIGPKSKQLNDDHSAVFSSLKLHLKEAKLEHYLLGTEEQYRIEAKIVACMQRLSQSIGGLRSAASTQFSLLSRSNMSSPRIMASPGILYSPTLLSSTLTSSRTTFTELPAIEEAVEEGQNMFGALFAASIGELPVHSNQEVFALFIKHLRPSMEALSLKMRGILGDLPYGPGPDFSIRQNSKYRSELEDAVDVYRRTRAEALRLLYNSKAANQIRPTNVAADFEEIAASCGHFSYSLLEFAEAMGIYLDFLDELHDVMNGPASHLSWSWLSVQKLFPNRDSSERLRDCEHPHLQADAEASLRDFGVPKRGATNPWAPQWKRTLRSDKVGQRIWQALQIFRRDDLRYAIKVGVGAAAWALPSFVASTRPFYAHWRGEWGLLSYMLVCSMHIGSSNTTGYSRFLGTCIGAIFAILAWILTGGNPVGLAFVAWLMSLWCFYIIVAQGKGPMGRFILLTFNLTALYAYSLSVHDGQDDDDEGGDMPDILGITLHRVVAVMTGCLWGLIITRIIFPISARKDLTDGLSLLWLNIGLVIKRDPFLALLDRDSSQHYINLSAEFRLRSFLSQLRQLHGSANSEIELKGPFPAKGFDRMLKSTGKVLDAFHALNVVINKDLTASEGERELLECTAAERRQLNGRIGHLFQVLASSLKLEYPLNNTLPSTEHSRDRLLAKIYASRSDTTRSQASTEEDFSLIYIYVLVTSQLSAEIAKLGDELEELYGRLDDDVLVMD